MQRREFIKLAAAVAPFVGHAGAQIAPAKPTFEEFIRQGAVTRPMIDRYFRGPSWTRFDPEVGYVLSNYMPTDGIDGSSTISTIRSNGARTSFIYAGRKCRINTYGNSFTQCHHVSDGETWQEYLAAHLGEPVGKFGMGGHGVYQAYLRMRREEQTDHGAEYVILYVWGDDHSRSLLRDRHAVTIKFWNDEDGRGFHGSFWANVEMDLNTGKLVEKPSRTPTRAELYNMTNPQWLVDNLRDDLALQLLAYKLGYIRDLDQERLGKLAACLNYPLDLSQESTRTQQVGELLDKYSLQATQFILEKARAFCRQNNKKLMVFLFDPRVLIQLHKGEPRFDQVIVDYLGRENFDYFDFNPVHLEDFKRYNLPFDAYRNQFIVKGHFNPTGNHFFAYSIKDAIVKWLDPKPITYRKPNPDSVDFRDYQGR
jgi:hypothetical protein